MATDKAVACSQMDGREPSVVLSKDHRHFDYWIADLCRSILSKSTISRSDTPRPAAIRSIISRVGLALADSSLMRYLRLIPIISAKRVFERP